MLIFVFFFVGAYLARVRVNRDTMPRDYQLKPGAKNTVKKNWRKHCKQLKEVYHRNAEKKFKISRSVLERHYNRKKTWAGIKRQVDN